MTNKRKRTKVPRRVQAARNKKYKFSVKTHPIQGILSLAAGVAALLVLLVSCCLAAGSRGNISVMTGLLNVFAFLLSIVGLALAFLALRKRDIHMCFPVAGGIVNGILTIVYLIIYVTGTLL